MDSSPYSADNGHEGVVRLLINTGADVAAATAEGFTVLQLSAARGHSGVLRLLIYAGADVTSMGAQLFIRLRRKDTRLPFGCF